MTAAPVDGEALRPPIHVIHRRTSRHGAAPERGRPIRCPRTLLEEAAVLILGEVGLLTVNAGAAAIAEANDSGTRRNT